MEDTYKGESPGKKLGRLYHWVGVEMITGERFASGKHMFLAAREGGDVPVLRAMGVRPENMVAVDTKAMAIERFRVHRPGIPSFHGKASDVSRVVGPELTSCFLDFCSEITPQVVSECVAVLNTMKPGAVFAVAVQRAREKASSLDHCAMAKHLNRRRRRATEKLQAKAFGSRHTAGLLAGRVRIDFRESINDWKSRLGDIGVDVSRQNALWMSIVGCMPKHAIALAHVVNYHSYSESGHGVPMTIGAYQVVEWAKYKPISEALRRRPSGPFQQWDPADVDEAVIRSCVEGRVFGEATADLLNIERSVAAAWRAHRARREPFNTDDRRRLWEISGVPTLELWFADGRKDRCRVLANEYAANHSEAAHDSR